MLRIMSNFFLSSSHCNSRLQPVSFCSTTLLFSTPLLPAPAAASPIADAASQHSPARFAPDWQRKSSSLDHADAIHVLAVFVLAQAAHCLRVSAGFRRVAAAYGDASALLKKPKMLIPALPFAPFLMSLQTKMCSFSRSVQRYPCLSVPHSGYHQVSPTPVLTFFLRFFAPTYPSVTPPRRYPRAMTC